jgi:hypothetical protein
MSVVVPSSPVIERPQRIERLGPNLKVYVRRGVGVRYN